MALAPPKDDYLALTEAMLDAYSKHKQVETMLFLHAGRKLDQVVERQPLKTLIPDLIMSAADEGWFNDLENAVVADRSGNPRVQEYLANRRRTTGSTAFSSLDLERLLRPRSPIFDRKAFATAAPELERLLRLDLPFLDPVAFAKGLLRTVRAVCRVDVDEQPEGTGFLIGRDIVLTNHHVISAVMPAVVGQHDRIVFWFDRTEGGQRRRAECAAKWLLASSPPSPLDTMDRDARAGREPDVDALDYVIIRLSEPVGEDPIDGGKRGFLVPKVGSQALRIDAPLQILQHPSGRELAFRTDTKAILGVNAKRTRVRYRTNTEHGSSGSPCFDEQWNLVALHHSGEKEYQSAEWNEGIPINTVFENLPVEARAAVEASRANPEP